eukprot:GHRQ01023866.1.p1 GENE.GHRQ01023866.1~~GHRQ01023866.1.p1  ORF type:complete len:102 (-),score=22.65 GHRQ01023866.1:657-962(-)
MLRLQEASQAAPCPAGPPPAPGEPVSLQQKLINTATSALQSFPPLNKICQHVCAFHCYAHDTTRQVCEPVAGSGPCELGTCRPTAVACGPLVGLHHMNSEL